MTALVIRGDARALPLPDESVDLIVTSPPYWALRSYTDGGLHYSGQIGSEATPAEWLDALIECTAEMVRVLKPSGNLFVNLGDKYVADARGPDGSSSALTNGAQYRVERNKAGMSRPRYPAPRKSLLLLPEQYRIACVYELGLIARAVTVWDKPNGLPESVTDRVRRSHEDWVHLVKQPRYYSAVDVIRETYAPGVVDRRVKYGQSDRGNGYAAGDRKDAARGGPMGFADAANINPLGKLPGSVWTIPSEPLSTPEFMVINPAVPGPGGVEWAPARAPQYAEAWRLLVRRPDLASSAWPRDDRRTELRVAPDHYAAFPSEWPRRMILGWSPPGICVECGEGRRPDVESVRTLDGQVREDLGTWDTGVGAPSMGAQGVGHGRFATRRDFLGWVCACSEPTAPTRPAVVLDPFGGTGTTAVVASAFGRTGITVDLSGDYCRLAAWRTSDPAQLANARREPFRKPEPQVDGQDAFDFGSTG